MQAPCTLSSGYHLAWAVGTAFVLVALALSTTLLARKKSPAMQGAREEMDASA